MKRNILWILSLCLGVASMVYAQADKKDSAQVDYGYTKIVNLSYDQALGKVIQELKNEGFGIITEIDVRATMKKKMNVDYRPYKILGASNPQFAHKALEAEEQIGLRLPCNVIVFENVDGNIVVSAIDPVTAMGAINNPELEEIAKTVRDKLKKVIQNV